MRRLVHALLLWAGVGLSSAAVAELAPFDADRLDTITQTRAGQPFVLVLWSIDCPPCYKELAMLGRLRERFAPGQLVLVSTDSADHQDEIEHTLARFGLTALESYVFADSVPARLRQRIDPTWFGELPRSYLYNADHSRRAISGLLDERALMQSLGLQ